MASSIYKPDVVSFHGYGGWDNSQGDLEIFDGGPDTDGLASIVNGVDQVRAWAPGKLGPTVGGTRQIPHLLGEDCRLK